MRAPRTYVCPGLLVDAANSISNVHNETQGRHAFAKTFAVVCV